MRTVELLCVSRFDNIIIALVIPGQSSRKFEGKYRKGQKVIHWKR